MKRVDFYSKVPRELTEATVHGSVLSLLSTAFVVAFVVFEFWVFSSSAAVKHSVGLELAPDSQMLIKVDISFPRLKCESAIVRLKSAYSPLVMVKPMKLVRRHMDETGTAREAYNAVLGMPKAYPGCRLVGEIVTQRTPATFEVVPPALFDQDLNKADYDLTHTVHQLSFGPTLFKKDHAHLKRYGQQHSTAAALLDTEYASEGGPNGARVAVLHYIHLVPTVYKLGNYRRKPLHAYQAVHHHHLASFGPDENVAARFIFDISPMSVIVDLDKTKRWYDFVTNVLAVVGGAFALAKYFNHALSGLA